MKRWLAVIETLGLGGGAEQLMIDLVPRLKHHGIECDVLALFHWPEDMGHQLEAQGFRVVRFEQHTLRDYVLGLRQTRQLIQCGAYHGVWSHLQLANIATGLGSIGMPQLPQAMTLHTARARRMLSGRECVERWLCRRPNAHAFAVSQATASEYETSYGLWKVKCVYNGVDTEKVKRWSDPSHRESIRARYGVPKDAFLIVVPARYAINKGHKILIEALTKLKTEHQLEPYVLGFGHGGLRASLQCSAMDHGLGHVSFHPPVTIDALMARVGSADLVVIPSLREPFGLAGVEAMAAGIPTLLSAIEGFSEIVSGLEQPLQVAPGDSEALALQIRDVMLAHAQHSNRFIELAKIAQAHVIERFDIGVCAQNWARELNALA